jgi:hypothetical protein
VDCHGLAVVIDNDDLEEPASPVSTDVKVTVVLAYHADDVADCVFDVFVCNHGHQLDGGSGRIRFSARCSCCSDD